MKDRSAWVFVAFALLVLGGIYLLRRRSPTAPTSPPPVAVTPAATPATKTPAPADAPAVPMLRLGNGGPSMPMPDGKTIDVSSGRPVIRDDAESQAALDKGVKEMEEAARNVTFAPQPSPAPKKKTEPAEPAPKL